MAVTRIKNNQVTDSASGNLTAGINAGTKIQDFSITAGKIANNLTYGSDLTITGNLTVNGQSTAIDTTITTIEDPVIVLASTQSGEPTVDIGFVGERGTSNNIAFVWDESSSEFVTAFTSTAETNTTITITSYSNFHTFDANIGGNAVINGTTSLVGNLVGAVNATGNITGGNVFTAGVISGTGNITGGNILTGGLISATSTITSAANISGGNIVTGGQVSATGNITGGNIATAGAFTAGSFSTAGNITGGNLLTGGLISSTGTITSAANISGGNLLTAGLVSATGNVTGGNIVTGGLISATSTITSAANISGGNIVTGGQVSATGNITSAANVSGGNITTAGGTFTGTLTTTGDALVAGNLVVQGNLTYINIDDLRVEDPVIILGTGPNGAPLTVNDGKDRGVFMEYFITAGNVLANAFMGYDNSTGNMILATTATIANDVVTVTTFGTLQAGNLNIESAVSSGNITGGNILTAGLISATGNISGGNIIAGNAVIGNINVSGDIGVNSLTSNTFVSATGNLIGGNVTTAGLISATSTITSAANISGGNLLTGGIVSATGNVTGGNLLTGGLISATSTITSAANVIGGNITTAGQVSATANITGGNILTGGLISATGNTTTANLILTSGFIDGPAAGRVTINGSDIDTDFAVDGDTLANVFYVDAGTGTASFGSSTQTVNALVAFNSTTSILTPVGNTAQRPATGVTGMLRFNTTTNAIEVYDNSDWVSVGVPVFTVIDDEQFNGDGSTVAFTLGSTQTTNSCIVSINGVVQIPTLAYSVDGTDPTCVLTFTEAPADGDVIDVRQITTTTTVTQISNSSGNAVIGTSATTDQIDITGDLVPTSNVTQDLGTTSLRWRDLYLAGNSIILGNTVIKNTSGNTIGFFGPDGSTAATIDAASVDTTTIANGTSSLAVIASGGNIRANIGGTTVATISSTGVAITGDLSVTGNATLTGNILGDRIQNGTTQIDIQTQSGNANITVGGVSNVAVFATTGVFVTGLASVTGNISGGNLSGTSIVGTLTTAAQPNITSVGTLSALAVTGNITSGNVSGTRGAFTNVAGTLETAAQTNITSVGTLGSLSVTGNVQGGNLRTAGLISATGSITGASVVGGVMTGSSLSVTGTVTGTTITGTSLTVSTGNVSCGNIVNTNANGVGNIGSTGTRFNQVFALASSAQYADLAEKYTADSDIAPGTVVCFGGTAEVTTCVIDSDRRVAGVVSTNPAYIMNDGLDSAHVVTVALTGRVPCRVTGTVRQGDLMVSAGNGVARAEANPAVGTVIGKALANSEGDAVIEVVVGRV